MAKIERTTLVPYSCQQMFDLVNDIPSYPEFVPGCVGAEILHQEEDLIDAELAISKAGIQQRFATRNRLSAPHRIDMELLKGPFRSLTGGWTFEALDEGACKIIFQLDFEFNSRMLQFAFGRIFNEITRRQVDAFANRARVVYG